MMRPVFRLAFVVLLSATPSLAQKISVLPPKSSAGEAVRKQLVETLCEELECVAPSKVADERTPDWEKAREFEVSLFIGVAVAGKGEKQKTQLSFFLKDEATPKKKVYPIPDGALSERNLQSALKLTKTALKEALAASRAARAETVEDSEEAAAEAPREERKATEQPLLTVEAGMSLFSRQFLYTGVQTPNLRSYAATVIAAPMLQVEYVPFAPFRNFLSGVGFQAQVAQSVALVSRVSGKPAFPSSVLQWALEARYRWTLLKNEGVTLFPIVGLRQTAFSVSPAFDKTLDETVVLDGLPQVTYLSVSPGVGAEMPFLKGAMVAHARFSYLNVLSSGEILSRAYFPKGSTSGVDLRLGVDFRVVSFLKLRLSGFLTRYGLTFDTAPTDPYVATGASDQYLGGNVSLCYMLF